MKNIFFLSNFYPSKYFLSSTLYLKQIFTAIFFSLIAVSFNCVYIAIFLFLQYSTTVPILQYLACQRPLALYTYSARDCPFIANKHSLFSFTVHNFV
jgi:hypothetical protein